ncbi:MAG TPA: hypothetical protein ENI57_12605 [Ignavibacteria bacterium]|nr:hypothetical protein [Ignavibacteria bacterium]
MKRIIAYIFLIVLFFVSSVFAQSNYKIELSGGKIYSTLQNTLLPYWDTGWSFGITASKKINKEIELTSSFKIQNFRFQPGRVRFPPTTFVEFIGHSLSVSGGENSNVYNFSLGIRVLSSSGRISTFFSLSGGLQYISQGKIFITSIFDPVNLSIPSTSETYLYNNNRNYLMGIASIGAGISFKIISKISLITEGRLITTFKRTTSYPILSTGIQYSF